MDDPEEGLRLLKAFQSIAMERDRLRLVEFAELLAIHPADEEQRHLSLVARTDHFARKRPGH